MFDFLKEHINRTIPISDHDYEFVCSQFVAQSFKKHQFLVQEGRMVPNDYFITKGIVKAYYSDQNGKDHILRFAMENWWISDYHAYFNRSAASLNIDCIERCEVLSLSLENREKLCNQIPAMANFFRKKGEQGYVALQKRILSLLKSDAKARYQALLKQYPNLVQRVPKTILSSYLGVSRETLSRLKV